ncbi:MAG: LptF/LptG family permease [Cytophagales bacterium]
MKKIDKLILNAFLGPFVLTFLVSAFIFLIQYLIKYFPDLIGKGLSSDVYLELFFYFSINVTPIALTLAMLLSSLISFGNLGEHFELTAIKSAGISLIRTLVPIFIFSILLCLLAFFVNNNIVPKANLKAFSLLYDVRQKKPTFEFKEGAFYNGIPGYSIKVNKKYEDGTSMKGVMIYNHSAGRGNTELIIADSGQMYMINNDKYLIMELFHGESLSELVENKKQNAQEFARNRFDQSKFVFNMSSFDMQHTQEELFSSHKIMRNVGELNKDVDSLIAQRDTLAKATFASVKPFYNYVLKNDTSANGKTYASKKFDYVNDTTLRNNVLRYAANSARSVKSYISSQKDRLDFIKKEANGYDIEWHRKFSMSFACLVMFLIGAPLGSIIKKGGLGVPVLIAIVFFIIYYIITIIMEKYAKEGIINVGLGMWMGNLVYLPIGIFFLIQAKNDSRILETDYFVVLWGKFSRRIRNIVKR